MELFRMIKSDARRAVRFCGGRSVASALTVILVWLSVTALETLLMLIFSERPVPYYTIEEFISSPPEVIAVSAVISVLWIVVMPALFIGYAKLHLAFAEGKDESFILLFDMFSSAKKFFGSIFFFIMFGVRYILLAVIVTIPGGALLWFSENYLTAESRTAEMLRIILGLLAITIITLCVALGIIFSMRWSLAVFYRAAGNSVHRSFVLSARAAKGHYTDIISFKFSFIGWGILSILIIPLVWTFPYYSVSNSIYAKYLMERYERSLAETPETIGEIPLTEED